MEDLTRTILKVPGSRDKFHNWFREIAESLLNKCHIESAIGAYRILEIEFYYYNADHPDESTYGYIKNGSKLLSRIERHKQAQQMPLTWFFHYSGIDISIGSESNPGGVLIRKIQRIGEGGEIFSGPLVVQLELMNQGVSIDGKKNFKLKLVSNDSSLNCGINCKRRVRVGSGGFENEKYNFSIDQ